MTEDQRANSDFRRVLHYAKRCGIDVIEAVPPGSLVERWDTFALSPASDAGISSDGVIYWWEFGLYRRKYHACSLLHEIGHVLLGEWPTDMEMLNEVSAGLIAHDYHVARYLRITGWQEWMAGFAVNYEETDWNTLPAYRRTRELTRSRKAAVEFGLLTPDLQPTFKKRRPFTPKPRSLSPVKIVNLPPIVLEKW